LLLQMAHTKKVKSTGRFGARYGRKIKLRVKAIEIQAKAKYKCPDCKAEKVKRISSGIWGCRKCGKKFAGAAYTPFPKVAMSTKVAEAEKTEEVKD